MFYEKAKGSRVHFYPWAGETKLNKTTSMKLKSTPYLKIKQLKGILTGTQVQIDSIVYSQHIYLKVYFRQRAKKKRCPAK